MELLPLAQLPAVFRHQDMTLATEAPALASGLEALTAADGVAYVQQFGLHEDYGAYFDDVENLTLLTDWLQVCANHNLEASREPDALIGPSRRFLALSQRGGIDTLVGEIQVYHPPACSLTPLAAQSVCIGYWVFPSVRRLGFATDMIGAFQALADGAGFDRVCAETDWQNMPSMKALAANGFVDVGAGGISTAHPLSAGVEMTHRKIWRTDGVTASKADWPYKTNQRGWLLEFTAAP